MTEILRVLVLYYACDIAAAERHLTPPEWDVCMGYYAEVKRHFAGGETGPQSHRLGYLGFKEWEDKNPVLVTQLRAQSQRFVQ
mmetsp:Transcript_17971/g.27366  ORF Transcript_17971/g.27366 Transcript_17971/m.27366 type:complete len:83 (+) Transcript_17971:57-305(+)